MKIEAIDWTGVRVHDKTEMDFTDAWKIQEEVGSSLEHHERCSSVPGWHPMSGPAFLCDCGAVEREWERRCSTPAQ